MSKLISRSLAGKDGLRRYYTGKACGNGHTAERHVSTGGCVECIRQRRKDPDVVKHYNTKAAQRRARWRKIREQRERERAAITASQSGHAS